MSGRAGERVTFSQTENGVTREIGSTTGGRGTLVASWKPASNASQYRVTRREEHGGLLAMTTRKDSLRIAAADPTLSGSVRVDAISATAASGPASLRAIEPCVPQPAAFCLTRS